MYVAESKSALEKALKDLGADSKSIGFVATMGALHEGHISLLNQANSDCDISVCSVFVNPTQFNESTDFEKYPRTVDEDTKLLEAANCDVLYMPKVEDIYPDNKPKLEVYGDPELFGKYEGTFRPGHFQGVVTVVMRFFDHIKPEKAYFGLKDYQQYMVIKRATPSFFKGIEVVGVATMRSKEGLALSSRNKRLSSEGLHTALAISHVLREVAQAKGSKSPDEMSIWGMEHMKEQGVDPEYLDICNAQDLMAIKSWDDADEYVAVTAGFVEGVRLIDNLLF